MYRSSYGSTNNHSEVLVNCWATARRSIGRIPYISAIPTTFHNSLIDKVTLAISMGNLSIGHPLILFLVWNLISTATAAFTQRDSWLRYLGFILCAAITWQTLSNFHLYVDSTGWAGRCLAGAVFSDPLVLFDRLLIRKWAFGHDYLGPVETSEVERKKQSRWEFGPEVSASIRCIGSSKEVANTQYFSDQDL
jgi:hypothetical protein